MKKLLALVAAFQIYATQAQDVKSTDISRDSIETTISKTYGLDTLDVNFKVLPKDYNYSVLGMYSPWSDLLEINYYEIERLARIFSQEEDLLLAKTMRHELGHYKVDKMCEKLGLKQAITDEHLRDILDIYTRLLYIKDTEPMYAPMLLEFVDMKLDDVHAILVDKMINEGIGIYFENTAKVPIPITWPTTIKSIKKYSEYNSIVTNVGHALVYPIISKHGDKGIEYLLRNMPTKEEFSNLPAYQAKALDVLGK